MGEKGRFVLPTFARKKIRESSGGRVLCLASHERLKCLVGYGLSRVDTFEDQIDREEDLAIRKGDDSFDRVTRANQLYGFAEAGFDDSGRFIMPEALRKPEFEEGLYFHGAGEFFTVWTPSRLMAMGDDWSQAKDFCENMVAAHQAKAKAK